FLFWLVILRSWDELCFPSQCSTEEEIIKFILSMISFFGGGFAVPIFLSCAVGKAVRFGLSRRKNNRT
ncbi:MAG: hypothetical protein ACK5UO_10150, partial [Microcystis sp.]